MLPTLDDGLIVFKEKKKLQKIFKTAAVKLFQRSLAIARVAFIPTSRSRAVNKLIHLGGKTDVKFKGFGEKIKKQCLKIRGKTFQENPQFKKKN